MATRPGEIRRYLINIYHDLVRRQRSNSGRRVTASEVGKKARAVQSTISVSSRFRIPSDRQIQRILEGVKVPETHPWSIGTLSNVDHAVLPFLMEMQEWCQSIGRTLTIDEAKWGNCVRRQPNLHGYSSGEWEQLLLCVRYGDLSSRTNVYSRYSYGTS